jgi:hypothetical protein
MMPTLCIATGAGLNIQVLNRCLASAFGMTAVERAGGRAGGGEKGGFSFFFDRGRRDFRLFPATIHFEEFQRELKPKI